jgi:hypothetical protein
MSTKKITAVVLLVLALGILGYWAANGRKMYTQTKVMKEVEVKDEVFGTTTTTQEWHDEFQLGLIPTPSLESPLDMVSAAPIAGLLILAGGILLWSAARERRRLAATSV